MTTEKNRPKQEESDDGGWHSSSSFRELRRSYILHSLSPEDEKEEAEMVSLSYEEQSPQNVSFIEEKFGCWYRRHYYGFYMQAYRITRDQNTAEEVAQEAFMKTFAALNGKSIRKAGIVAVERKLNTDKSCPLTRYTTRQITYEARRRHKAKQRVQNATEEEIQAVLEQLRDKTSDDVDKATDEEAITCDSIEAHRKAAVNLFAKYAAIFENSPSQFLVWQDMVQTAYEKVEGSGNQSLEERAAKLKMKPATLRQTRSRVIKKLGIKRKPRRKKKR